MFNILGGPRVFVFCFVLFIGIIGGTPGKRIYEGLFCFLFFWGGSTLGKRISKGII